MINQLRIYTINRGAMDEFLAHFHDQTLPLHKQVGIDVTTTLVNRPQNEFIWVRTFENDEALKKYEESPERAEYLPINRQHLAKTEFRNVEEALRVPAGSPSA